MKTRIGFFGNPNLKQRTLHYRCAVSIFVVAFGALIGLPMTGCATPAPVILVAQPVETEIFRAPWSAYTIIPSRNYVVVGAIALRHVGNTTFLADLMERAIEMEGHDLINVRLAVTSEGNVTGATAVVIRYTEETIAAGRNPSWAPLIAPRLANDAGGVLIGDVAQTAWPTQIIRVPWAAYTFVPSKHYVAVGAIVIRNVNRATLLVDLMERAIEIGGHDIINVRLAMAADGTITVATAVAIMYTDETVYVAALPLPEVIGAQGEAAVAGDDGPLSLLPGLAGGIPSMLPRPQRTPRAPREGNRVNWLSGEATFLGGGIRYERDVNNVFSVGGNLFYNLNFIPNYLQSFGLSGTARFFPGGSPFYIELGAGFGWMGIDRRGERWVSGRWESYWYWQNYFGLMVTPAIGARLGGQTRGFFVNPFASLPVVIGAPPQPRIGVGLGGAW
ncbi:MAG: hypothetical protein FWB78_00900 [Treponema sp.]|nr:hypothetical protein [Treponema sp.]